MRIFKVTDYNVLPNTTELQTEKLQAVLDMCKPEGGRVVFSEGFYRFASVYVYSDTEIYLESGAVLIGSDEISDYRDFDIPEGVCSYHDCIVLKPQIDHFGITCDGNNALSLFKSINEKNISFTGEAGSLIDGTHCFNPNGDQGYRGPHTVWMTACENVNINGLNITRSGQFAFQLDGCKNITLKNVNVTRGDDGIHLNCSENITITDSVFECGDDCIAGLNLSGLTVDRCFISSACDSFRLGGKDILIQNCRASGPCKYPHRVSTAKFKNYDLPDNMGRCNTNVFFCFFASDAFPMDSENIVIRNCEIDTVDRFLYDLHDFGCFQTGGVIKDMTLDNVTINNLEHTCFYNKDTAFTLKNVTVTGRNGKNIELFE